MSPFIFPLDRKQFQFVFYTTKSHTKKKNTRSNRTEVDKVMIRFCFLPISIPTLYGCIALLCTALPQWQHQYEFVSRNNNSPESRIHFSQWRLHLRAAYHVSLNAKQIATSWKIYLFVIHCAVATNRRTFLIKFYTLYWIDSAYVAAAVATRWNEKRLARVSSPSTLSCCHWWNDEGSSHCSQWNASSRCDANNRTEQQYERPQRRRNSNWIRKKKTISSEVLYMDERHRVLLELGVLG